MKLWKIYVVAGLFALVMGSAMYYGILLDAQQRRDQCLGNYDTVQCHSARAKFLQQREPAK